MGDTLYFTGSGSSCGGRELWKTDGTSDGTVCVKDINPGSTSSDLDAFTVAGGTLFFRANDGTHGNELWKSDGTEDGTVLVKDISSTGTVSNRIVSFGNIVYFGANDGSIGGELWRSDGTEDGTYLVKDIAPGWESSHPKQMTPIGDRLFFTADDDETGDEVWISDGTESGTVMVANVNQNEYNSGPVEYVKLGNLIVFAAHLGTQRLVSYDPTDILYHSNEGMHWSISPSLPEGLSLDSSTGKITGIPTEVIDWTDYTVTLTASNPRTGSYSYNGNGTAWMVKDIYSGSDGSDPEHLTAFGNEVYFEAYNGTHQLWKSDGTSSGTVQVKEFNGNAFPGDFTVLGNTLFFTAETIANGRELWRTDGTENGTYMVKDIYYGNSDSDPEYLTVIGNTLYFAADDGNFEGRLWKSDGTENGTHAVGTDMVIWW